MIVQHLGDEVRLIFQHDHALHCGELAAAWGAPPFQAVPMPAVTAARLHDAGWQPWDAAPQIDSATGLPYRFYQMPVGAHLAIFRRGIAIAAEAGDLPGMLVSLHAEGLYNGRFGLVPGIGRKELASEEDERAVIQFLGEQARLRDRLRERLGISAIDPELWRLYRLLQVWDILSLSSLAAAPRPQQLPPAPAEDGERDIMLYPLAPGLFSLAPWPFRGDSLETCVPARRVPAAQYTAETIAAALERAMKETLLLRYIPGA
ncbi:MAG: DUF3891 family protein [Chloroflexota bacterium]|nr:DUF3891 family protein [Dehalococcoidia bacterium]MDW8253215.1 DUF3891 family protein [Chloroflexota bacterium]